jgi:GNAT superfamily N-acetyltransferase
MGSTTFQREKATFDLFEELLPLLEAHYLEIAHFQDIPLEPDFDRYVKLDENGVLRVFTARDEAGKLVGYSVYLVSFNLHYRSSLQAIQDILYISPDRRGFGRKFIAWCDDQLRAEGVQATYHHVKSAHDFGPLLARMGYECVDHIYARRLDR